MNNIGKIIIMPEYWTDSVKTIIDSHTLENTDTYSLLFLKFKTTHMLIHLQIPEYKFHCTLVPDHHLQLHRRQVNNWGTRISYGDEHNETINEFFFDGNNPWYLIPIIAYDTNILHLYLYKYVEDKYSPIYYFSEEYIQNRCRAFKDTTVPFQLKPEFKYEKYTPTMAYGKKNYASVSFEEIKKPIEINKGIDTPLKRDSTEFEFFKLLNEMHDLNSDMMRSLWDNE